MAKRSVLICDDAKIMRLMMRKILEESGYFEIVGEAADGVQAVAEFQAHRPSVVLLDLNMPVKDGGFAAREILKIDPQAKIILTTSKGSKLRAEGLQSIGIEHFLYKPFDQYSLVRTAMKACGIE